MIQDKQIEIKPAVPRDQMPAAPGGRMPYFELPRGGFGGRGFGPGYGGGMPPPYGQGFRGYGPRGAYNVGSGQVSALAGSGPGARGPSRGFAGPIPGNMPSFPASAGGMPRGYGGNLGGKGMGYDFYNAAGIAGNGAGNMFGTNAQALYNLTAANLAAAAAAAASQPHLNGSMAGASSKLTDAFNPAALKQHLAAAGLAGLSAGFGFGGQAEGFPDDPSTFSSDAAAEYAAAQAAAVDLNATGLQAEFNAAFRDTGFATSPSPGWTS